MGVCMGKEEVPLEYENQRHFQSALMRSDRNQFVESNGGTTMTNGEEATDGAGGGGSGTTSHMNGNAGSSSFDAPRMPIIFMLGGPGSGKITHSENLARQRRGFIHVNITQILQEVIRDVDIAHIGLIPTSKVTNTVMTAIRMNRGSAKCFLISGYPRNMRDVAEYLERIGRLDGVILLNWDDSTLERQIEYGVKMGEIEFEAAKAELRNFRRNVIPVAEYFDYKQLLYVIGGERAPELIYDDIETAVNHILNSDTQLKRPRPQSSGSYRQYRYGLNEVEDDDDDNGITRAAAFIGVSTGSNRPELVDGPPMVIWVMGGPGSSKTDKMEDIAAQHPEWRLINASKLVWDFLGQEFPNGLDDKVVGDESDMSGREVTANMVRKVVKKGEMVPQGIILNMVIEAMQSEPEAEGFFISGFPRDIVQAQGFEERTGTKPVCVLIDCSELELGRNLGQRHGRVDDNLDAYKRRLQLYRELSLPLLKTLDEENRLKIVDGDSDGAQVLRELRRCIHREIASLRRERAVESIDENKAVEDIEDEDDDAAVVEGATTTSPKMITGVVMNGLSSGVGLQDGNDGEGGAEGAEPQRKKIVRHYEGVNPEVEAELQKVIEELQTKEIGKGAAEGIQVANE